jgi:hypothetical protein
VWHIFSRRSRYEKTLFRGYCAAGCGKPVFSKDADQKYCSQQCSYIRFGEPKECPTCGKRFRKSQNRKYCSMACYSNAVFNAPESPGPRRKLREACALCGNTVRFGKSTFCSQSCHRRAEFERRCRLLESGGYCGVYNSNGFIKKYLIYRYGEKCSRCGWAERHPKTGKVPVEVEHIDGDWRNSNVGNLTLLCPNCHSPTATYRGLNRGRGRAKRLGGREHPLMRATRTRRPAARIDRKGRTSDETQLPLISPT